jgi:hypothetical protein
MVKLDKMSWFIDCFKKDSCSGIFIGLTGRVVDGGLNGPTTLNQWWRFESAKLVFE